LNGIYLRTLSLGLNYEKLYPKLSAHSNNAHSVLFPIYIHLLVYLSFSGYALEL